MPASRPRVTKWGVYYTKTYTAWRKEAYQVVAPCRVAPFNEPVALTVLFAVPRAEYSKLIVPKGDGDNFEKSLFDLLQKKGYLADDNWITTCTWRKRFIPFGRDGYIEVEIAPDEEEIDLDVT